MKLFKHTRVGETPFGTVEQTWIRRLALFGAVALATFATITGLEAAQTPSPALLITVEGDHALQIADPLTLKVVATVHTEDIPHEVAVSDDGKFAFMAPCKCGKGENPDSRLHIEEKFSPEKRNGYISVIDLVAQKEVRRLQIGLGSKPHGLVFAGGKLYYTVEGYKAIQRYDPATNQIDWMIGIGESRGHLLVVTKDLKKIFTANSSSNSVSAITPWDVPDRYMPPLQKVTTIPVGNTPEGIAMSPDEKEVWVTTKRDRGVSIIDTATLKVIETLDLHAEVPLRLQFTPDGKRVLIAEEFDGHVLVLDAATRKEIKRVKLVSPEGFEVYNKDASIALRNGKAIIANSYLREIEVAPDGSRAYVALFGLNRVDVIDLKTLETTGSIPVGSLPKGIAWAVRK